MKKINKTKIICLSLGVILLLSCQLVPWKILYFYLLNDGTAKVILPSNASKIQSVKYFTETEVNSNYIEINNEFLSFSIKSGYGDSIILVHYLTERGEEYFIEFQHYVKNDWNRYSIYPVARHISSSKTKDGYIDYCIEINGQKKAPLKAKITNTKPIYLTEFERSLR